MDTQETEKILKRFINIKKHKKGDDEAVNKPLLLLYALGKYQHGMKSIYYAHAKKALENLLNKYGTRNVRTNAHYAFYRLSSDIDGNLWKLKNIENCPPPNSSCDISGKHLEANFVSGCFAGDIQNAFDNNPALIVKITQMLLDKHFPPSLHNELIETTAINIDNEGPLEK